MGLSFFGVRYSYFQGSSETLRGASPPQYSSLDRITMKKRVLKIGFTGIKGEIIFHEFKEVPVKTLLFTFSEKRRVLSTRDGFREVKLVGENSCPPKLWEFVHRNPETYFESILDALSLKKEEVAFLFTGADVEKGVLKSVKENESKILIFVTTDVKTNAMRAGQDKPRGKRKKISPGTINIFLFTEDSFSEAVMARSLITITEAKVEALQDLDVRSSYNPSYQATGTGTDNIVVVSGKGARIERLRGHSKLSRLIARLVVQAVEESVKKKFDD